MSPQLIPEDIDTDVFHFHSELHPDFWDKNKKVPQDLRNKMLAIVKLYLEFVKIPPTVKVQDIVFTGSLCGFNYTEHSDVDLHIVVDYTQVAEDKEFVEHYFKSLKDLWADEREITIKEYPVELFVQDISNFDDSPGSFYSLVTQDWVKHPDKGARKVDTALVIRKAEPLIDQIESLENQDHSQDLLDGIEEIKQRISKMRKAGLAKEGEYSPENLAFKVLRNGGYLQRLTDLMKSTTTDIFSVNEGEEEDWLN